MTINTETVTALLVGNNQKNIRSIPGHLNHHHRGPNHATEAFRRCFQPTTLCQIQSSEDG